MPRENVARDVRVKNRAPAPVQITAEQLVREAADRAATEDMEMNARPAQSVAGHMEMEAFRLEKRQEFERRVRRDGTANGVWLRYAEFEEALGEIERARSVYERALECDPRHVTFWTKYAELETRHRNVNRARNIWDRAVKMLPRVSLLWYRFALMEEVLGNFGGARQVFVRWMQWSPPEHAWLAFAAFELRLGEVQRARDIYEKFVECHPSVSSWLKFAKFEQKVGEPGNARDVFARAVVALGDDACVDDRLFLAFARFEEKCKEPERARAIYKYALDHVPKARADDMYAAFAQFEKIHGDRESLETVIISKRRMHYEELIREQTAADGAVVDYDVWFDYVRLEEENGSLDQVREIYERAVACVPPDSDKRFWRRYIFLWLKYALFEELTAKDLDRARDVYETCLKVIPHKKFSFAKIWVNYAKFELRRRDIDRARAIFGTAVGMTPEGSSCRAKILREYIAVELQLAQIDRCRKLYEKYIMNDLTFCKAYIQFAAMEKSLREVERARAILEIAVGQPVLDQPEVLWKYYIDFECDNGDLPRARSLYRRLLERTKHVKVWISAALFEHQTAHDDEAARAMFVEAEEYFKGADMREDRAALLQGWLEMERDIGDEDRIRILQNRQPQRVIKRRQLKAEDGTDAGVEESWEYIFPGEEGVAPNLKFLERARQWKKMKMAADP